MQISALFGYIRPVCLTLVVMFMVWPGWAQIQSIGVAGDGEITRFTLQSDTPFEAELRLRENHNERVIELISTPIEIKSDIFLGDPTGGVSAYEVHADRIRLELDQPMVVLRQLTLPPIGNASTHRFILDLTSTSPEDYTRQVKRSERKSEAEHDYQFASSSTHPVRETPPAASIAQRHSQIRPYRIVIDPGHGGYDPGALSVIGGKESEIVLLTALELKALLEPDPRYQVYLTRDSDVYIEHEDRVSRAREWGADLFISLHADAGGAASVQGASVYTISTRGEARIEDVSRKFGWALPFEDGTPDEVSDILQDLTHRETKSNSTIFAEFLVPELSRAGPLLRNTHRKKNLFVLLAPDVPAVLVEIGFLTNRSDAERLRSEAGRRKAAKAIQRAIHAYFDRKDILLASR